MNTNSRCIPIAVLEQNAEFRALWMRLLLSGGYIPTILDSWENFIRHLATGKFPVAACRFPNDQFEEALRLKIFREKIEYRFIQIILILQETLHHQVLELIKAGFYNILAQNQMEKSLLEKLGQITEHLGGTQERRQHIRIQVMEYENARLVLSLSNNRKITSIIKNISLGGLQVAFRERIFVRFSPGDQLPNSLMIIKDLDMSVDLEVISLQDRGLQLKFINLDTNRQNRIAQFIYERLQFGF